ncbi:hypothetical protein SOVF_124470 [Spinacia oleracea]|nr:hypothetical protein SOVF_124470 [Spinacia oleracea]
MSLWSWCNFPFPLTLRLDTAKVLGLFKHSAGHIYLRFDSKEAAMNAQRGMHTRWFGRRLISASYMQPQKYEAMFVDVYT